MTGAKSGVDSQRTPCCPDCITRGLWKSISVLSTLRSSGKLAAMVVIAKHREAVERLNLTTLTGAKAFKGELVKDHRGRRDIFRIRTTDEHGHELVLFLKRNWKPYKKDGLASILKRGKVWSIAREEWENSLALQRAGLKTCDLVAYGEEIRPLWENFSFIVTGAATGKQTVQDFLRDNNEAKIRQKVFDALALEIRKMHDSGLATPDLFTRHIFVDESVTPTAFCLIDMARLDCVKPLPLRTRARDLAALHVTAPLRFVSVRERLRFLKLYAGKKNRELRRLILERAGHLLQRRKFRDFADGG